MNPVLSTKRPGCPAACSCNRTLPPRVQRLSLLRARVQSQQQEQQPGSPSECSPSSYPAYEETETDDGLLPKRQPGQFPQIKSGSLAKRLRSLPVATQVVDSIMGTNVELEEGAVFDPLRDGPLRYLGYANECGEAFAAWLPIGGVPASYAVAVGYVVTDTIDKGFKAYAQACDELEGNATLPDEVNTGRLTKILALERSLDTIVWQLLASVICPGYTIHTIVWLVHLGLVPLEALAAVQRAAESAAGALHSTPDAFISVADKSIPTAIGLAVIPFIVHPIDNAIHAIMNASMRPAVRKFVCGAGQGNMASLDICDENCYPGKKRFSTIVQPLLGGAR